MPAAPDPHLRLRLPRASFRISGYLLTDIAVASFEVRPATATAASNEGVKKYRILDPPFFCLMNVWRNQKRTFEWLPLARKSWCSSV